MATRTVACPECGSESAPGRYTCGACGALLDGVAVRPRAPEPAPSSAPTAVASPNVLHDADDGPMGLDDDGTASFDGDEPLAAGAVATSLATGDEAPPQWPVHPREPVREPEREWMPDPALESEPRSEAAREVSWPVPSDRGPMPLPEPRVPAGAYLPPSAVLPPLDATGAGAGRTAVAAPSSGAASASAAPDASGPAVPRDWLAAFGPAERRHAAARRAVATGAGLAVLGFVLPWANVPAATLMASWLDLWGLAGAGHWLIAAGLVALALVAALPGRTESWSLGLPAVVVGALLGGLVWPYVFGAVNRPFGVLVVLVGAIVLVVGGGLDLAGRHEDATPAV